MSLTLCQHIEGRRKWKQPEPAFSFYLLHVAGQGESRVPDQELSLEETLWKHRLLGREAPSPNWGESSLEKLFGRAREVSYSRCWRQEMETVELDYPFFVGVHYHTDFLSRPIKSSSPYFGLLWPFSGGSRTTCRKVVSSYPGTLRVTEVVTAPLTLK